MNKVKMFDIKHEKMEEDSLHQWCCSCHCSPADGDHFMHLKHRLLLQCKRKRLNVYMFKFHHIFHIFRETKQKRLDKVIIIKWTVDKMWFQLKPNPLERHTAVVEYKSKNVSTIIRYISILCCYNLESWDFKKIIIISRENNFYSVIMI